MDAQQTSLYIAIAIGFGIVILLCVTFIIIVLRNHRQKQRLYQAKIVAEIETLEKERSRLAADLHDELGPLLVGASGNISGLGLPDPLDAAQVEKAQNNIESVMNRMREIARDLLPQVLQRNGLEAAMLDFLGNVTYKAGLTINFTMDAVELPPERSVHLFRILQEVVNNTIKHAKATELHIGIHEKDGKIYIETKDNGVGFAYAAHAVHFTGLGLRNVLSRTEVLGGKMYLESSPGKGTAYHIEIPT